MTRLVLINAIYFKGQWNKQFNENLTKDADFFSSPDTTKKVSKLLNFHDYKYKTVTFEIVEYINLIF